MPTTIKTFPGDEDVATGENIKRDNDNNYLVRGIEPYPNLKLKVDEMYSLTDPNNPLLVLKLKSRPGAGNQTAVFFPEE